LKAISRVSEPVLVLFAVLASKHLPRPYTAVKKLLISPINGQYEQSSNAVAASLIGVEVFDSLDMNGKAIWQEFLNGTHRNKIDFPDYADVLVEQLISNVEEGNDYDDISSLQVW